MRSEAEYLAAWVTHMPLVTNEDWRDSAFTVILEAFGDAEPEERIPAQIHVAELSFAALSKNPHNRVAQHLLPFVSDLTVAKRIVELHMETLQPPDGEKQGSLTSSERLLQLLTDQDLDVSVLEAVYLHLEKCPEPPKTWNRSALAGAALNCRHPLLRRRLQALLDSRYDSAILNDLEENDLLYLADRPKQWWINHFAEIEPARVEKQLLVKWTEYHVKQNPLSLQRAVILALHWLSQGSPAELSDFWFELALSPNLTFSRAMQLTLGGVLHASFDFNGDMT